MINETRNISPAVFFLLGRARSGTTLLRSILDHHSNVQIPPECAFVNYLWSKYHRCTRWSPKKKTTFFRDLIKLPSFGYLNTDKDKLHADLQSLPESSCFADLCRAVWSNYRPLSNKENIRLLGDKNPHYSLFVKRFMKTFPDALFIHLVRDPRGNVQSLMEVDFEAHMSASLAWRWMYYNKKVEQAKALQPARFLTIRYEDLVREPIQGCTMICNFLGIAFQPEMLQFYSDKEKIKEVFPPDAVEKYHSHLFVPVNEERVYLWKSRLNTFQIRKIEAVSGTFAKRYHYEKESKKGNGIDYLWCIPGICYGALYMVWGSFIDRLPFSLKMGLIRFMAILFRPWWHRYQKA